MQVRQLNVYFFFFLLIGASVVAFYIFQPFLTAIVAAAILSILFKPTYRFLVKLFRGSKVVGSFVACLAVAVLIVTPIVVTLSLAVSEANNLYHTLGEGKTLDSMIRSSTEYLREQSYARYVFSEEALNPERISEDIKRIGENALGVLQAAYQSVTHFVFWVFVMFFTLFYLFIDGEKAFKYLLRLSPLKNEHERLLADKFISISRATLKGTLVVGTTQGLLGGIAFWIAGVPSPAIWGLMMILLAMIPLVGSALVWVPAGIILLLVGSLWQGVFILAFGFGVISVIDNILRPRLVGKDTQMHPLMIFFAILGGISFFGLPGFVIGPILVSLFLALWEIYAIEFKTQLEHFNS
jgi:predicted PurR-regulated permease PerM